MTKRISRRNVLGMGVAAGLAGCQSSTQRTATPQGATLPEQPKNIIFMVVDGMSMGVPSLGEPFSQMARQQGTCWHACLQHPEVTRTWQDMASLNSLVTDSAAAASAWGSGSRVFNGAINMLPDGTGLVPIAHVAKNAGMNVGLVTTTSVAHATPAGFASVSQSRGDMDGIAQQYLQHVDVLMGGGMTNFTARKDKRDLYEAFRQAGYQCFNQRSDLKQAKSDHLKTLGLFSGGHLPYVLDQRLDTKLDQRTPALAEMTRVALDRLSQSDRGFLLQIEGGRIDHAAHNNDAAAIMWEFLDFDDALRVVWTFCQSHPDTLVVLTSDHGNSNPGLVGMGTKYNSSTKALERLAKMQHTQSSMLRYLKESHPQGKPSPVQVQDVFHDVFGLSIDKVDGAMVATYLADGEIDDGNRQLRGRVGCMGQVMGNVCGVQWTGTSHTADNTLLLAWGPGHQCFATLLRNTDVFTHLTQLMGQDVRNPQMLPEEANKYLVTWTPPAAVYRHLA